VKKNEAIKQELIKICKKDLEEAKSVSEKSKSSVQTGDLKSDGKYDTRAVEASYLAGAQLKRVQEIQGELELLHEMRTDLDTRSVSVGSIVELEFDGNSKKYFLSSARGGSLIKVEGNVYLVISVFSPIGNSIVNQSVGDEVEVELDNGSRIYKVLSIQ